ncbi:ankyrin repeat domain-containing protein [Wolbachia endosymbiont of Anopheles demeilloni]|uniref:ankyrin repeat domain-containing protein n=1 Tax=Wolbachia endosymbiont of Anopheles demeilloni TaxID=2748871 RepID=UPI001BD914F3|nr:ankyrin repeat domain-containing protein [Wolbachia endosymbiont of Anopheles demeilloni]UIP92768.1 ankyrin repeat domain-containing protein [Wolbachia endosymbiont of Anopheles demeilloni]
MRTNRYHEEDQILDKNKHTNSVLGIDINSRSSQSSEHEGDDISKPQNEKGKHNQNKKKKAKKCHQVQKVKPEFSFRKQNSKKPQNEKYKQDLNDEEESKRLEKNTNELFLALKNKNLKKAERLIEQGVNVYARDKVNRTFLHWSVENGYYEVVKSLLSNGADVHAVAGVNQENLTSLHTVAGNGYIDIVKLLLDYGADVNAKNASGRTPLQKAAENGRLEIVKYFIEEKNVDVNAKTKVDNTPLHLAVKRGLYDIVKFLLKNGAEVDANNKEGFTPLDLAIIDYKDSIVTLFLDSKRLYMISKKG